MGAKLIDHQYGKSRVRVLKVLRDGATHTLKELDVSVRLSGDFESSYTSGDNGRVILTDTMKNTVHALAKDALGPQTEPFALTLARHFLERYEQVRRVTIKTRERVWDRLAVDGTPHPHSFTHVQSARPAVLVKASREGIETMSGLENLLLLKSTASSFKDYPKDEFTTLPETDERIFATSLIAFWRWGSEPTNYLQANETIRAALIRPFALNHSPSVQTTLFQMGEAALAACAEINRVHLAMPNKHYLPINLAPFGRENRNEVFLPTDEPHGQIEATITRD